MTTDLELTAAMREQASGLTLGSEILDQATRRHRRRAATIRLGSTLGVVGLAGVLAAGLTSGGAGTARPGGATTPTVQAMPAAMRLVNAATASDDISYRLKLTTDYSTYSGAFDPRTATGYVRTADDAGIRTELLIHGTRYIGTEPRADRTEPAGTHEAYSRYGQYPGTYDRLSFAGDADPVLGAAAPDPAALLAALRGKDADTSENPDGTLHFRYTRRDPHGSVVTSGDVTLNADGRIGKVTTAGTWESTAKGRLDTGTFAATLELSDYGVAVRVHRPADVVPAT